MERKDTRQQSGRTVSELPPDVDGTGRICDNPVVLDEATLFNIAVDPAFQRRGLGRELLTHLIRELETRDVFTLWLEVRASNVAAIALYESLGFNEATIRRNYYPTAEGREDAIIMALPIG